MKKRYKIDSIVTAIALLFIASTLLAQRGNPSLERLYLSTDREGYVAGEGVWISLYAIDLEGEFSLSSTSAIAYLELHNNNELLSTAKIAIREGRGAGTLELPPNLATGNYKIIAYTKEMLNQKPTLPFEKIIPIYNGLTVDRVEEGVELSEEKSTTPSLSGGEGRVKLSIDGNRRTLAKGESGSLTITNSGDNLLYANISIYKIDSLSSYSAQNIENYLSHLPTTKPLRTNQFTPEYEGEIIEGVVESDGENSLWGERLYLTAAGGESDIYSTNIDSLGRFKFYTLPFFGERDLILEAPKVDSTLTLHFELTDPFIRERGEEIPKLLLNQRVANSIEERTLEMQIGRRFGIESLYERVAPKVDPLLDNNSTTYILDHYKRFRVMEEVVAEFISELRFRRVNKKRDLQVRIENSFRELYFSRGESLVLLDGVPLFDHNQIFNYDPLLVESVTIYKSNYYIGISQFSGIASFKTYRGDYSGLSFSKNVKILEYKGALHPTKLSLSSPLLEENLPDLRSLLYWDPLLTLEGGERREITFSTSSKEGNYLIKIEGITSNGEPSLSYLQFLVE